MKILISDAFDPSLPEKLARFGEVFTDKNRLTEADVILVRSKTKCTKDYIDQAANVKIIIRGGVGMDNIDTAYAAQKGIMVKNTADASSIAVAELAFALLLAIPNQLMRAHNSMADGKWLKKEIVRSELYGKTLGLWGMGNIGSEVGKRAMTFGMRVLGYDLTAVQNPSATLVRTFDELLAEADYLSLHVPLTQFTQGFINKEAIAQMKDGAAIVNTARSQLIVKADLVEALNSGKLAAYAADVWDSDPPDPNDPLFGAPNVLMTPHLGASSKENLLRIGEVVVKILDFQARTRR